MKILIMDSKEDFGKAAFDELSPRHEKSETYQCYYQ